MPKPQSATAPAVCILLGLIAFFFAPLLGVVLLLIGCTLLVVRIIAGAANAVSEQTKACPFCAETIKAEAKVCRFCGRELATPASTPIPDSPSTTAPVDREKLMKDFGITFDGERYHYQQYRYEKFEDAVNYAIRNHNRA